MLSITTSIDVEKQNLPNQPTKAASLIVLISGIHLYVAKMNGSRLKAKTARANRISLQTVIYIRHRHSTISNLLPFAFEPSTHSSSRVLETAERNDSSDIDETSTIEKQIDNVGEHAVFRCLVEETAVNGSKIVRLGSFL